MVPNWQGQRGSDVITMFKFYPGGYIQGQPVYFVFVLDMHVMCAMHVTSSHKNPINSLSMCGPQLKKKKKKGKKEKKEKRKKKVKQIEETPVFYVVVHCR